MTLQQDIQRLERSLKEAHAQRSKQVAELRTEVARLTDQRLAEAQRADLAEERLARIRDLLQHANEAGARELATAWDIERKRRNR